MLATIARVVATVLFGFPLMLFGLGQLLRIHNDSALAELAVIIGSYVAVWFLTGLLGRGKRVQSIHRRA